MRAYRALLAGLLTIQAGASSAQTARADLRVSATVLSICAISSGPSIAPLWDLAATRGTVHVNCAPAAPYRLSLDPAVVRAEPPSTPSARALQRVERRGDVLVVEIAY